MIKDDFQGGTKDMSRVLFLADLHGNYTATLAMEEEIRKLQPDEIWFLGDAVGKGPSNDQTCDWVKSHCDHFLKGNWDEWVCHAYRRKDQEPDGKHPYDEELKFFWNQLGEERIQWLESLQQEDSLWISGMHYRIIHGRTIDTIFQGYDPDNLLRRGLRGSDGETLYDGLICADSHRPFIRGLREGYVVNTGSVGNAVCRPRASALLVEGDFGAKDESPIYFTSIQIPYDNTREAEIARATEGLPHVDAYIQEVLTGVYAR